MPDNSDLARGILNLSGFPFQHYCLDRLSHHAPFQVAAEVAFTHPPTNGPMIGIHGAADIVAACPDEKDEMLLCFVIECKKANDKIKNWILIENKAQSPRWPTFIYSVDPMGGTIEAGVSRSVRFPALGYGSGKLFDYCINGIELNVGLNALNRDADEKIYKPMRQVAYAVRAIESTHPKIIEGVAYLREGQYPKRLYIPVVLTTANLYKADFRRGAVEAGEIQPGDLKLGEPRKWLSYEFPLPDFLGYEIPRDDGTKGALDRRTIFVVNYEYMDEFFDQARGVVDLSGIPTE